MGAVERVSNLGGSSRTVKATSEAIPALLGQPQLEFVRVSGREALSELFTYTVDLRAVSPAAEQAMLEADLDAAIGQEMTLTIELDGMGTDLLGGIGAGERQITGIISSVEQIGGISDNRLYRYTLRPWLWLATRTADHRPFQNRTVIEILDEVLSDYIFSVDMRLDVSAYPKLEWEVQHGETDAHFIQRLTEEWGITYFFEHDGGHHRLVLVSESGAWRKFPSEAYHTLPIYPHGFKVDQEHLTRFELIKRLRTGRVTLKDYDPRQPKADLTVDDSLPRNTRHAEFDYFEYNPGTYVSRDVGNQRARIRMEEWRAKGCRVRGAGALRGIAAGSTYQIANHDNDALNREFLVISAELQLEDVDVQTGSTQRYACRATFEAQPIDEVFRPARTAHKPRVRGIQRAVVTGPKNQEVWCNDFGCVKVQFEWDRYGRYDENSSPWVRVASNWSGNQFGGMHIPRIGQEVLVDYLNGDPNCPIIIGRVPNQLNLPPWALPSQHALSGVASKELFGRRRNHLLMDDTQGQIQAQLSSDHQTSQLNLGYLTGVPGNPGRKDARGEGFDLRTDGQGTLRGAKGLFFTTEGQIAAVGGHLDRQEFTGCMKTALEAAKSLGDYSSQHEALKADTDPQADLAKAIREWDAGANNHKDASGQGGQPIIGAYAPAGMAFATLKSQTSYAGQHIDTISKLNQQVTAGQQYLVNAGTGISLFAHSGAWKGIAHQGQLVLQAQQKSITANAKQDVVITATDGTILQNAKTGITLMSGNAGIRIADGAVEIFGPTRVHLHTDNFDVPGAQGIDGALPQFDSGDVGRRFRLIRPADKQPVASRPYEIVKSDGSVLKGVTNALGEIDLYESQVTDALSVTFGQSQPSSQGPVMTRTALMTGSGGDQSGGEYQYQFAQPTYQINQAAYLFVEGVGVNGAFNIKGNLVVKGDASGESIWLNAMGYTSAGRIGKAQFFALASLRINGNEGPGTPLSMSNESGFWPKDTFVPIGTAVLKLPRADPSVEIELLISGGYLYKGDEGHAVPAPSRGSIVIPIQVVRGTGKSGVINV
ncbi:type VI secretion system Vgr family protein [Ralstonia sp. UBA689]|uniref:type VI secretion system Vgr family protein n=1 Tax=Ralstonia sp. UBA689 TaxID=1947373 RepID=UPI0025CBD409|nr:type VI secretion system tip protein TssI/VgrG [Ralstonia sp. UBA689]